MQMGKQAIGHLVGRRGTARTAFVPARVEHEVADDELASSEEEIEQAGGTIQSFEGIILLDLDHRQLAAPDVQRIAGPRHFLFGFEQFLARHQPLLAGYHLRKGHLHSSDRAR